MKIITKEPIRDLTNKETKDADGSPFTVGRALASILLNAKEGGKMKMYLLAQKLYDDKPIEIDQADLDLIKRAVETSDVYGNLVTGQLLVMFSNLKQ